ncbi:hypothetical protein EJB05_53957, partial [Eragrostis curvula]
MLHIHYSMMKVEFCGHYIVQDQEIKILLTRILCKF